MLREILVSAKADLSSFIAREWPVGRNEISDEIAEIADVSTPVYTGDILACAVENMSLATSVPELGPAFDGENTAINLIAANIYERISNELYQAVDGIVAEVEAEKKAEGQEAE